jgi:hypothetical protein
VSKHQNIRREGAYVVKAAESPSSRVTLKTAAKTTDRTTAPSARDRRLARAVVRHKTA